MFKKIALGVVGLVLAVVVIGALSAPEPTPSVPVYPDYAVYQIGTMDTCEGLDNFWARLDDASYADITAFDQRSHELGC